MPLEKWQPRSYADLVQVQQGFPFKSEQFSDEPGSGPPLVRIRDLEEQQPKAFVTGVIPSGYEVHHNDTLIGMDGDFLARRWKGPDSVLNQRVCRIKTRSPSILDEGFLFYSLQPELDRIHRSIGKTTVKHLSVKDILGIERLLPPISEQRKIAAILSSIDDTTARAEAVINQLEIVRKGLLGELLTQGIPGRHKAFKATDIGSIPAAWDILTLGDLTESSAFGPRFSGSLYDSNGAYATLRTTDISEDGSIDYTTMPRAALEPSQFDAHTLRDGDLLTLLR